MLLIPSKGKNLCFGICLEGIRLGLEEELSFELLL